SRAALPRVCDLAARPACVSDLLTGALRNGPRRLRHLFAAANRATLVCRRTWPHPGSAARDDAGDARQLERLLPIVGPQSGGSRPVAPRGISFRRVLGPAPAALAPGLADAGLVRRGLVQRHLPGRALSPGPGNGRRPGHSLLESRNPAFRRPAKGVRPPARSERRHAARPW